MEKNRPHRARNPRFQPHFIKRLSSWLALSTTLTVVLGEALTRDSEAATYTWQIDAATSNWNVDGNWANPGFPNAIDDVANLTNNITANQAVSLNQSITVGTLNIGDPNGSNTFTLAAGTGGYLFMDVSTGSAGITKAAGANASDTISTGIQFNDGLVITNNSTGSLTLSGGLKSTFSDVTFGGTGNVTVSTAGIATSGSLVKNDGGTLTLSIANTYSGTTTINGGTLALNVASALPARSAVIVAAGATLDYLNIANSIGSLSGAGDVKASTASAAKILTIGADNTSTTFSGRFVAPGTASFMAITKTGSGTLTLAPTAASTYTGATVISGGTLLLDFSAGSLTSMLAATPVTIGGGNLQIKGRNSGAAIDQTVGALTVGVTGGAIIMDPNGSALGTRLTTGAVTATAAGGALLINAPANTTVRLGTALNATTSIGRIIFTDGTTYNWAANTGATTATTALGTYTDVAGGTPSGTDTNNSRINSANVNESTAPSGNWTTNSLLINAGASGQTLALGSNNLTLTNGGLLFTGNNDYSITGTGALNSASGANSDLIIQHFGTGNLTIAAPIGAGTGAQTLTKAGTGLVTLTGTNVFTGGVFVNGGTLSFSSVTGGAAGGLGNPAAATAITIRDGATLQYTGPTGTIVSTGAGSHTYSLTGGNATIEVTTAATSLELNGIISGTGGLTKIGPGILRLNASNTYTGVTTISTGTVQVTGSNSIPDASPVFIDASGKLDINGTAATQTENIGSLSGSGTVLNSNTNTKTLGVGGDNTSTTFSGTFAAGGVAGNILSKNGTGILTLNGTTTSAWTGGNNFNSGVVRLASSNVLSATGTTNLDLLAGPATLELTAGVAQTLGALNFYGTGATTTSQATVLLGDGAVLTTGNMSLSATGSGLGAMITGTGSLSVGAATRTYTINDSTSVPSTLPELTITVPIISVGAFGITKAGAGNLLLLANNSYTGTTAVNAGQMTVSGAVGAIASSPTITVGDNSGAADTLIIGAAGDAWAGGAAGRLNDTAAITLAGGSKFTYAGPASGFTTETVGVLTVSFGSNSLTLVPGTGSEVILAADSLVRTNTGVLLVRGNNLGTGGVGNTRLSLTTAPSGTSFVGGGGAGGTTNISIVPWLVGDLSATGAGSSFVTYDTVQNSLRALANTEYVAAISGAAAQDNVSLSAADTVSSATTINALRVLSGGSSTLNAATTVTSGAVLFAADETLAGSGSLAFGTVQGILTAAANTTPISGTINATITGSAGILVNSLGDVANAITLGGSNTFTGGVVIGSGTLRIGSSGALNSAAPNVMNLSATNSVLELNGINTTVSNLTGVAGSIVRNSASAATTATLTVASSGNTTFTGSIVNGNAGAILNLVKTGTGSLSFTGTGVVASSYTGSTDIQAGALILGGTPTGQLTGTTLVSIEGAGILRLSNSDSTNNSGGRLNDGALVNMYGGTFDYDNNATSGQNYSETIGAVSLAAGANVITADRASVSGVNSTTLTITSLARVAGSGATLELTSQSNNTAVFDLGLAARSRVVISGTVPTDDGIIPFAVTRGADVVVGNLNPYEFVKYVASGTISATALVDADYALNTGPASWTSAQNIKLTTSNSLSLSTDTQINSINFQTVTATTLDLGSSTLRVESGGILASQNNATSLVHTINNGTLTAGTGPDSSGELIFQIFNIGANTTTLTVNSTVADNGLALVMLTKAGSGTLKLGNATNTYSGQTSINAGALQIVADGSLGIVPSVTTPNWLRLNGGTLQALATFELDSHRGIGVSVAGGTLSVDPTFTLTYNGLVADNSPTGAPGKLIKAGNGTLILGNTANTYSGGTTITLGTLNFGALGNLGTGGIVMGGGVLQWATGNTVDISTRAVTFTAAAIFDTNGNNVTLNNSIGATAAFGMTKNGAGTLYLKGTNAFTGATTINAGVLKIDAENNLGAGTADVTFSGAGTLEVTTGFNANAGKVFAFGVNAGTLQIDAGTLKISSAVTVGTAGTFIKSGAGTVALSVGSTAIDGAVRLDAGVLSIDAGVTSIIGDSTTARAAVHFNGGTLSYDNDVATAQSFNTFLDADSSTIVLNRVTAGAGVINVLSAPTMTVPAGNAKTLNLLGGSNINAGTTEGLTLGTITLNAPITFNISNPTGATTALTIGAITTSAANTITLTGGGTFSQTAVMGGSGGTLTLDSNFTGTANLSQANTFSGGLFVNSGTAAGTSSNTAFGTGPITLGDTAANPNSVTLTGFIASAVVANAIVLNSGTTGAITLASTNNTTAFAYSGGVTGSNSVTLAANGSQALNFTTNPINIAGTITNAGIGTGTVTISGGVGALVSGLTQNSATSPLVLSGANNFGGPVSVLAGTLSITGALNAPGSITGITVSGGGALNLVNGAGNPLTALTSLSLGTGSGIASLGLELGATSDTLTLTGAATTANSVQFNLTGLAGLTAGTYNLITATSGLSGATYSINSIAGIFGYTLSLTSSDTLVQLSLTPASGNFYWRGSINNSWAGVSGSNTNFTSDLAGAVNANGTPGTASTVIFSATSATGPAISTTLDGNMAINDLKFTSNPSGVTSVTIAPGTPATNTLTIAPAVSTDGIDVADNAGAITISAKVVLGADQTWTVAGTGVNGSSLSVTGGITGAAGVDLTKEGDGTLTVSGTNTYAGATTVNDGVLLAGAANAFSPNSAYTIGTNGTLRLNGLANTIASLFGSGIVQNNHASTAATLTIGSGNFSGALQNGGAAALAVTKNTTGTLTLAGDSTYTGNTTVSAGTLNVTGSITGNTTTSTLVYGGTAGATVVNVSGDMTLFATTGGNVSGSVAVYNQSGGTVTVSSGTGNSQFVAKAAGSYGYFNLTGGTYKETNRFDVNGSSNLGNALNPATSSVGVVYVGGTGFLDNRNGDWFINGYSLGEITVAGGGSIDHTGAANPFTIFMDSTATGGAYGILNLAGGTVTVGAKSIQFGNSGTNGSGNTGFINLAAGTLSVGAVMASSVNAAGGNSVYLNFAGGTLKNSANVTNWIPGSTAGITYTATLYGAIDNSAATGDTSQNFAGGLTVDTNGFTSSLSNVFNPASGAGVTQANLTVNGGSGYVGAPAVIFSTAGVVAGGSPAAGYALISGGQVVGIVITSPGTYTPGTVPTITLTGGGGTGASVTAAALNTANLGAGITKIGNGTLTLSGTSTFTAPLTIKGGAVASATFNNIGVNGPLGAGIATSTATNAASIVLDGGALSYAGAGATTTDRLVTVTPNGGEIDSTSSTAANTITFTNTNSIASSGAGARTLTFGGANTGLNTFLPVISDANAGADAVTVAKIGAGRWLLAAANTYTGGTNIAGGILAFDSGTLGSTGNVTFTGNSTLQWDGTNTQDVSARLVLANGVTGTIDTNGNNLVFANGIGTVGGTAGVLVKTGAGSLTLNGASTYSGGTTLTTGTLNIGNASALGTGTFTIAAGTTFDNTTGGPLALATNNAQAWNGDFTFTGSNSLDMGNGAVTLSAARTVTITANTLTVGGAIGGLFALTKNGNGALYLAGTSTFGAAAGSTVTINGGVLKIDSEAGLGNVLNDVTFAGGTTLEVTNGFTANAGKIFNFTAAGGATFQVDSGTMTITSALTGTAGTGGLIKTGAGTLALSGASTAYDAQGVGVSGATGVGFRVDQGTLLLTGSSNSVVGDVNPTSMTMQLNGGDLTIQTDTPSIARANLYVSSTATLTADNATSGVGILQAIGTGTGAQLTMGAGSSVLNIVGGANVTSGTEIVQFGATTLLAAPTFHIVNPAGATTQLTLGAITGGVFTTTLTGNGNFTQTGAIASTGGFTLDAAYSGLATLSQANTYSGTTAINGGTLAFAASNNLGDASVTNQIAIAGGTLRYTGTGTTDLTSNRQVSLSTGTTNTVEVTASTGVLQATGGIVTTGAANLVKTGLGVFAVTGPVNLHGGNVTVSDGTLSAGFTATGANTIAISGTGSLQLIDGSASTLTLASSAGSLTLNAGARVGFELAASGSSDTIVIGSGGSALTSGGTITLDFYALGGFGAGTYTLLQADSGLLQGGVTYVLGTAPTGFNYILSQSDTQVSLTTSVLSNRYWTGTQGNSWATLNAGPASNFSTDAAGTIDAGAIPGAADTVIFSAGTVVSTAISTTLDAAFTIDSLQFLNVPATVATVTIAPGTGGSLTISPVSTSNGITVAANGGVVSITAPLTALTAQTWSVDGTGSSALTINGNITFTAPVTKTGSGILTLTGNNTGAGGLTLTGGTLRINSVTALGTGPFTIGAGTTIDNTSAVALVLTTNNAQNWNGSFTFTGGTHSLDLGTGAVTLGNSLTATISGLSLTIGGAVGDGGNARSLTKSGAGTLVLNGNNTYDGLTTVTAGVLTLGGNNSAATGGVTIAAGTLNLGTATALGTGTFTISGGTINNTAGSALTLSTNNPQNWNANFTFTGTNALNLGTGAVTLGAAVTATVSASTLTVGGVIDGGVGIVKDGAGTLSLGASNTYLGGTTINNGTLTFTANQNLTAITNNLTFGNTAGSTSLGTLNLNTASATFGGAVNVQTNSNTANVITIGSGQTLQLNGAVTIGYNAGANTNTKLTASGLGTLSVGAAGSPTNAGFTIGGNITTTFSNAVTLDLSGLAVFYANLGTGTFRLGDITNAGGNAVGGSTLILAANSTIITATLSSDSPDSAVTQALKLGSGANIIDATTITIGAGPGGRSNGSLAFNTGTGTLTIRDLAGTGRATMTVVSGATATGAGFTGTVNLVGHSVDLLLSTLSIGSRSSANAGVGDTTGTFSFDTGLMDVTTIALANRTGSVPTVATDIGTLNFMAAGGSGTVTVGALNMAVNSASNAATSGPAIATLNIGGTGTVGITTLTMANDSIGGGATAQTQNPVQSTVNISGSTTTVTTLNMNVNSSANTGTGNASLSTLNISGGTVHVGSGGINMANASNAAATATSTINLTGGTLTLGGNLTYTAGAGTENTTLSLNGATAILDLGGFNIGTATSVVGSGTGSLILQKGALRNVGEINGGGAWSKTGSAADVLTLDTSNAFTGAVTVAGGVLRIMHGNALGGVANGTSVAAGAALEISNSITTAAEPLTLNGAGLSSAGALRSTSGTNTFAGAITLASDSRINSDAGTLTLDVASGNAISGNFGVTFGGPGQLVVKDAIATGANTVTKDGAGTLTLAGSNTYTGLTDVTAGKLIVSGSLAGDARAAAGATLASGNNTSAAIAGNVTLLSTGIAAGTLAPGDTGDTATATTIGRLNVNGNVTLGGAGAPAHLAIEIGGSTGGTLYDQIQLASTSTVTLTNATLDLSLANSFNPTTFTIATFNTGTSQLNQNGSLIFIVQGSANDTVGTFLGAGTDANLAGFGTYNLGGQEFAISYQANATANGGLGSFTGGHDIALMAIPEPNSLALLSGSLGLALSLQRFRRKGRRA